MKKPLECTNHFSHIIASDAYEQMTRILRFPQVTGQEINGQLCRITNQHDLSLSLNAEHLENYKDDMVLQVRLMNNDSREFVVMNSMVTRLPKPVQGQEQEDQMRDIPSFANLLHLNKKGLAH